MLRLQSTDRYSMYIESPPEIEIRDGLAHVSYKIGGAVFEYVMLPSIFRDALVAARGRFSDWEAKHFPREIPGDDSTTKH